MTSKEKEIENLAENLRIIMTELDILFVETGADELLSEAAEKIKSDINYKEASLPLIIASGGNYNSTLDKAKIKEIEALNQLIKARRELTEIENKKLQSQKQLEILKLFGIAE